jgi:DNA-directed RNA polymerase subunit omega
MPETFEKTEKLDSAYRLVIVAAKRSKELQRGAQPRVDPQSHKPTTVAVKEVKAGKVNFELIDGDEEEA